MPSFKLIAIAAMASNRIIGRHGDLPWHLPEDLKFFKETTKGHTVLMGRKTFDSIIKRIGKPLPDRTNLVLSKTMPQRPDAIVLRSWDEIQHLQGTEVGAEVYLIGGAQLYQTLLPECEELLLTYIHEPHEGDASFPPFESLFRFSETLMQGAGFDIRRYLRNH